MWNTDVQEARREHRLAVVVLLYRGDVTHVTIVSSLAARLRQATGRFRLWDALSYEAFEDGEFDRAALAYERLRQQAPKTEGTADAGGVQLEWVRQAIRRRQLGRSASIVERRQRDARRLDRKQRKQKQLDEQRTVVQDIMLEMPLPPGGDC